MNRILCTLATLSLTIPLAITAAHADDGYGLRRSGVTFGGGLGAGTISCSDDGCKDFDGAGSIDLHVGGMLGPRVALIFDVWWMLHNKDRVTVEQGIVTAAVRAWPIDHFWLQGGLGVARSGVHYSSQLIEVTSRTEWVPGFHLGIGVEPIATNTFALDISLRYGTGFYSDGDNMIHNASLNLGVSFY